MSAICSGLCQQSRHRLRRRAVPMACGRRMEGPGTVQRTGLRTSQVAHGTMHTGSGSPHCRHTGNRPESICHCSHTGDRPGTVCHHNHTGSRPARQLFRGRQSTASEQAAAIPPHHRRLLPSRTLRPLGSMELGLLPQSGERLRLNVVSRIQGIHQGQRPTDIP